MLGLLLIALVAIIALTLLFGAATVIRGLGQVIAWVGGFIVVAIILIMVDDMAAFFTVVGLTVAGLAVVGLSVFGVVAMMQRDTATKASNQRLADLGLTADQAGTYRFLLSQKRFAEAERFLRGHQKTSGGAP